MPFSIIDSIIRGAQDKKNIMRQSRANKQLAEYSYSKNYEQWLRENEYNTPAMQMQRLQDAGLNPNLVYGTGSVAGNTTTQGPKYQQQAADYSKQSPKVQVAGALQNHMMMAQIKSIQAATEEVDLRNIATKEQRGESPVKYTGTSYVDKKGNIQVEKTTKNKQYQEFIKRTELTKTQLSNAQFNTMISKWKAGLAAQNLNPNDNILLKTVADIINKLDINIAQVTANLISKWLK